MGLFSSKGRDLGIDIGTLNTHIYVQGRGVVLSEPSVVATDMKGEGIVAIGEEAERMLMRTPDTLSALRPLKDGFIVDYRVILAMLNYFMNKSSKAVRRSRVVLAVPCGITDVERRAMTDAILQTGAREAYLLESPVAAALGCDLPIFEARGSMVVDIGGGTTDIAVLSLGGKVIGRTARVGGQDINRVIAKYIRECFSVMVPEEAVEDLKIGIGSALPASQDEEYVLLGRDMANGLMKRMILRKSEIYEVMKDPIQQMVEEIRTVVEQTPPELLSDIMESGLVLTGATALMDGLPSYITETIGIPVRVPEEPGFAVALGLGRAAVELERMERFIIAAKQRKGRV